MQAQKILESALYVEDLEAAEDFYSRVLGLELNSRVEGRHAFFHCGEGMLLLFNPRQSSQKTGPVPVHGAQGPGHLAFAVEAEELEDWRRHLAAEGVAIETEVQWPHGGRSIYFRDPAGNSLELATPDLWR